MPRDGSGVYSAPPGSTATPNTTILSAVWNALVADLVTDANAARPISAGGTGSTSALAFTSINNTSSALNAFVKDQGGVNTVSGTNTIALTTAQSFTAYGTSSGQIGTGTELSFVAANTNTSSTVNLNVNTIGNKAIRKIDNSGVEAALIPGDITKNMRARVRYDSTANSAAGAWILLNPAQTAPYPSGHLYGLTLSNNASDATNDIDIAVGGCRDSTDAANIDLAAALTKRLDASWVVGTNQGMLDGTESVAGTPDTSTWYHIWLIKRPDTGVVDVLASESASSPTMPTNYTLKRYLFSVYRTSGAAIRPFTQRGDTMRWNTAVSDRSSTSAAASALLALSVPTGFAVFPILAVDLTAQTSSNIEVRLGSVADAAANTKVAQVTTTASAASETAIVLPPVFLTNTSAQLYFSATINSGSILGNTLSTLGWVDTRGRV